MGKLERNGPGRSIMRGVCECCLSILPKEEKRAGPLSSLVGDLVAFSVFMDISRARKALIVEICSIPLYEGTTRQKGWEQ